MLYFFLSTVLIDFLRLLNWLLNFYPLFIKNNYVAVKVIIAIIILSLSTIVIILGYINTRKIVINNLEITLPKKESSLSELNTVLVADFHLTPINDGPLLEKIVQIINRLNPDVILMPGDIVDDRTNILRLHKIGEDFLKLKSKYGIYASTGNHEFITGIDESERFIKEYGIKLIRDSVININDDFYIIGRDDRTVKQFTGYQRKSLNEIMKEVKKNIPVLMLDHSPFNLEEAEENKIDLQLSGHTHHGQIFPANLITSMIYEVSWGYLKKGKTQYFVTCGVGTWGPPVRIASDSEIVNLKIKFRE